MNTTGMSEDMLKLFQMMKMELEKQTAIITQSITETLMRSLDDKIQPILEENKKLKEEIETLNRKMKHLDDMNRKNNLLLHGVKEAEKSYEELFNTIKNILSENLDIKISKFEINKYHRLGPKQDDKTRPILITFTSQQKRSEILINKKKMPQHTYITEDFSKETIEARKNLQLQLKQEKERGNIVFIRNNKLVIKEKSEAGKRKREASTPTSPNNVYTPQRITDKGTIAAPSKMHKIDAFAYMRARSVSLSEKPAQQKA